MSTSRTPETTRYARSRLAGSSRRSPERPVQSGSTDGTGAIARFHEPYGLAVGPSGNVYVADLLNHAIRRIAPDGTVTTFAGGNGKGSTNGTGAAAKFSEPRDVAVDTNGTIYVADYFNHLIRKITSAGVVTTLAGRAGKAGSKDGVGRAARFRAPTGIALDATGTVYVADTGNRAIRKIGANGKVTTLTISGPPSLNRGALPWTPPARSSSAISGRIRFVR